MRTPTHHLPQAVTTPPTSPATQKDNRRGFLRRRLLGSYDLSIQCKACKKSTGQGRAMSTASQSRVHVEHVTVAYKA